MKYDKNNPLRVFEAFAGYGSQSLALERLKRDFPEFDYKLIGFSEIDPSAITAYKALHGDVENYGDISKIDWGKVPDFDFFTMSSPCFVAGTLVLTSEGYKPIEEVKVGDMVLTHMSRFQKVLKIGSKFSTNILSVKADGMDITYCTPNHPYLVKDKTPTWKQAGSLTMFDKILRLSTNHGSWVSIKSVRLTGKMGFVYNIEVEEDHSYTANGAVVHNCQDFSNAGLQRGGEEGSGTRSSLLWECSRAIELKRPKYVFFENVKGLVQQKFIKGFNAWQRRLEGFGYVNFAQVLNASDFNVPQNRERIYMISILITEDEQNPRYFFPKKMPLELCLNDVLEEEVDEKYFLSDEMLARFCEKSIEEDGRSASSENDFDEEDEEDFENFFVAQ